MSEINGVYHEDEDYYRDDYEEDYNDEDDYDDPYYENYIPYPEPTLANMVSRWIWKIKNRWSCWRHRDEISDIPF